MGLAQVAQVLDSLDPVLWAVTAAAGSRRAGLIATNVSPASIVAQTPRLLVSIARHHHTWDVIQTAGAFAVHLFTEERLDWVWRLGLASGHAGDKLGGFVTRPGPLGSPLLAGALAWLECRVEARLDTGDRTVNLAAVVDGALAGPGDPLSVKRMLALAPERELAQMQRLLERDAEIDRAAILAWRQAAAAAAPAHQSV
jgi:flavin reductase (DIM6/NTAB) family NADH-FMN oxidoreductase RutF